MHNGQVSRTTNSLLSTHQHTKTKSTDNQSAGYQFGRAYGNGAGFRESLNAAREQIRRDDLEEKYPDKALPRDPEAGWGERYYERSRERRREKRRKAQWGE